MKKGMELRNKMKKLNVVRTVVHKYVEGIKDKGDMWHTYFSNFSIANWKEVGVTKRKVQDVHADGEYNFNNSIHNFLTDKVVDSLVAHS